MPLQKRKHPRLKEFDYSQPGYYYVTIHIEKDRPVLSMVGLTAAPAATDPKVGRGLAPAATDPKVGRGLAPAATDPKVGRGLAPAAADPKVGQELAPAEVKVTLTKAGRIANEQLLCLQKRYPCVKIDKYVIMPTHIHAIIVIDGTAGASPRPTLTDVICTYKSLTTRETNKELHTEGRKFFQTSFYESVLRSEKAYQECWKYIDGNPGKWLQDPEEKEWNMP